MLKGCWDWSLLEEKLGQKHLCKEAWAVGLEWFLVLISFAGWLAGGGRSLSSPRGNAEPDFRPV